MEAGLREEQPTPPPADSPQRHNSALSNAGCSSGAGASDEGWRARVWPFEWVLEEIMGPRLTAAADATWPARCA